MSENYDFFIGKCEFIQRCPDVKRLRESQEEGIPNLDLEDQYFELCTSGGKCLIRDEYLSTKH